MKPYTLALAEVGTQLTFKNLESYRTTNKKKLKTLIEKELIVPLILQLVKRPVTCDFVIRFHTFNSKITGEFEFIFKRILSKEDKQISGGKTSFIHLPVSLRDIEGFKSDLRSTSNFFYSQLEAFKDGECKNDF